jgi:hypothetical protein
MTEDMSSELEAEIESFRAELRVRAEQHDRAMRQPSALDLPPIEVSRLDSPEIRALISQRYEQARVENRLREVERRLAEIEARNG